MHGAVTPFPNMSSWCGAWLKQKDNCTFTFLYIWRLFAKFMDLPYYSKSELCGGAVMISFSKYLPWQVMHFLQHSTYFSKCAADCWSLQNFLPWSSLFMVGTAQNLHGVRSGLYGECSNGVPQIHFFQAKHRIQFRSSLLWNLWKQDFVVTVVPIQQFHLHWG
jgi:hypothetical protein